MKIRTFFVYWFFSYILLSPICDLGKFISWQVLKKDVEINSEALLKVKINRKHLNRFRRTCWIMIDALARKFENQTQVQKNKANAQALAFMV